MFEKKSDGKVQKPRLIIIGENHAMSEGTDLLKGLTESCKPFVFLEIHDKFHVHRLYKAHVNQENPEVNESRMAVLGNLAFNYEKCTCVDMDYQNKYYMNDSMRESLISKNIGRIFSESGSDDGQSGILLVGYSHITSMLLKLDEKFDVMILLPEDSNISAYKDLMAMAENDTEKFIFHNSGNLETVKEMAESFFKQGPLQPRNNYSPNE